jgi:omega-6 fatty acid desaturase (delta-12 desaturase)
MFIIYHDFHHGAVFRNSKPATWILNLFGLLVLNPPNIWKRSHNYHHRNNSQMFSASIGSFPVMTKTDYAKAPWFKKLEYQVARHWITIAVAYVTIFVLGMCLNSFRKDPLKHWDSLVAVLLNAALFGLLLNLGGWQLVLLGLVWPLTLSCALGAYLFYIQHNFPDVKIRPRETWDFFFAALHSSSYMEGGKFTHWFTGKRNGRPSRRWSASWSTASENTPTLPVPSTMFVRAIWETYSAPTPPYSPKLAHPTARFSPR